MYKDGSNKQAHDFWYDSSTPLSSTERRVVYEPVSLVAVITSSLAGRAGDQADSAQHSATELATLYGLSQTISAEVAIDRILHVVAQTTAHLLNVPVCTVLLYDDGGRHTERAHSGDPSPLIENAEKYTPADTPIIIEAGVERDTMRIEVRDQGPGIPAGLSTRIFEKFVRVAGPERHADGMRLGLAICKGRIDMHQGRIWAENLPDGGARFIFTLPLHAPANGAVTRTTIRQMQADSI